jgi:glycosyltransferase involved in cell wall biosynthesis
MRTLFCNTPYGTGGIGQHFAQLVRESHREGCLDRYYAFSVDPEVPNGHAVSDSTYGLFTYTPIRFLSAWKSNLAGEIFDRRVARILSRSETSVKNRTLMGFAGASLRTFQIGRAQGVDRLELVAPNSHVENVARLHARAAADSGIRDTWLNDAQRRKTLREYAMADRIYVHSDYVWHSFVDAGIPASKLVRSYLCPHPRFQPPPTRPVQSTFRIAYVGRVEMTKGLGVLLDAFDRLPVADAQLHLVGGWSTRTVRRAVEARQAADPRIVVQPGDPLPILQSADVFVHPSYEDGFGYAPMEALACGTPVLVTAETGMAEYVVERVNGRVLPTGCVDSLVDGLLDTYQHPLAATRPLLPAHYYAERSISVQCTT